jgi:hypothetical protein
MSSLVLAELALSVSRLTWGSPVLAEVSGVVFRLIGGMAGGLGCWSRLT